MKSGKKLKTREINHGHFLTLYFVIGSFIILFLFIIYTNSILLKIRNEVKIVPDLYAKFISLPDEVNLEDFLLRYFMTEIIPNIDYPIILADSLKTPFSWENLEIEKIATGLIKLRTEFSGKIFLEVFFVPGFNDSRDEVELLKKTITKISPDIVQLNTLDRPGTESWVKPLSDTKLKEIAAFFQPLPVEIISKPQTRKQIRSFNQNIADQILETIKRRPCTDTELAEILNLHLNELNKYLSELLDKNLVASERRERGIFFKIKK